MTFNRTSDDGFSKSIHFKNFFRKIIFEIFKQIRNQVCLVLLDILVQESHKHASTHFPTAYFQKYIVVPPAHDKTATEDDDCWSLICLRNMLRQNLEFKFVRCCEGGSNSSHKNIQSFCKVQIFNLQ